MLVLNRKNNEEIYIETPEGRITLKVIEVDGKFVKIGIDAPKAFPVYREELYRQVNQENKESIMKSEKVRNISDLFKNYNED
ncbi:MAG TPA: carbon storage regulator CsrA [Thermotogota bacterium]|nr:carbon storage regulator CsrA [Thermotogota bacterium]HPJ88721.1 carbon storage regulator CsrA [Thermotogota bacterium]HPR97649.1 carbon storage regulator CsrA [Thermotogota bacterium]